MKKALLLHLDFLNLHQFKQAILTILVQIVLSVDLGADSQAGTSGKIPADPFDIYLG